MHRLQVFCPLSSDTDALMLGASSCVEKPSPWWLSQALSSFPRGEREMAFHGQTFLITFAAALRSLADSPEKEKSPLDVAPSREQACDWPEIIGLLSGAVGMICSGTLAKAAGFVLGWGVQRGRMSRAGGAVVIRSSAGARGCLGSPGVRVRVGRTKLPTLLGAEASSLVPSQEPSSLQTRFSIGPSGVWWMEAPKVLGSTPHFVARSSSLS